VKIKPGSSLAATALNISLLNSELRCENSFVLNAKKLRASLDRHMIMKQLEASQIGQLLADCHFSDGRRSEQNHEFHSINDLYLDSSKNMDWSNCRQ
jgi:hypothetical protein